MVSVNSFVEIENIVQQNQQSLCDTFFVLRKLHFLCLQFREFPVQLKFIKYLFVSILLFFFFFLLKKKLFRDKTTERYKRPVKRTLRNQIEIQCIEK